MNQRPIEHLRQLITDRGLKIKNDTGQRFLCQCPAHEDRQPSCHVFEDSDGHAGVRCYAGCTTEQVVGALGLTKEALFRTEANGFIQWRGKERIIQSVYRYEDRSGELLFEKLRLHPRHNDELQKGEKYVARVMEDRPEGKGYRYSLRQGWYEYRRARGKQPGTWKATQFDQRTATPPAPGLVWFEQIAADLYQAARVYEAAQAGQEIWLVEGEKDVRAMEQHGLIATTRHDGGGTKAWKGRYTDTLQGASVVNVIPDRDEAGAKYAQMVYHALRKDGLEVVLYKPAKGKDPADHFSYGYGPSDFIPIAIDDATKEFGVEPAPPAKEAPPGPPLRVEQGGRTDWDGPLPTSDMDMAGLMAHRFGQDLKYCPAFGCWFEWDGQRWREDETAGAPLQERYEILAREVESAVRKVDEPKAPHHLKPAITFGRKVASNYVYKQVDELLRRRADLVILPDDMDNELDLLPCANGVVDLRTGELHPHDRSRLVTQSLATPFDITAKCPTWYAFLKQVTGGDVELALYLQVVVGYWFTGHTREQKFWFINGAGATGKTTFLETIQHIMGGQAASLDPAHLMQQRYQGVPEHLARLRGKRLVTAVEANKRDRFDEGLMKRLTGGETIVARRMRENSTEFIPRLKLVVTSNHRPGVSDDGTSFWRRMQAVPFVHAVSEAERDPQLPAKLRAEAEGILAWAVKGAMRWYEMGRLPSAGALDAAKREYQEETDELADFIMAHVRRAAKGLEENNILQHRILWEQYLQWCDINHVRALGPRHFKTALVAKGYEQRKRKTGRVWVGIRLVNTCAENMEDEGADPTEEFTDDDLTGEALADALADEFTSRE